MRITDNRYRGELEKFDLAVRMIGHEARTGTIRAFTGFTEDRVRKLYATYFRTADGYRVRRRRGKSPRQIERFVSGGRRQHEATVLACLFQLTGAIGLNQVGETVAQQSGTSVRTGQLLCQAYETYLQLYPRPSLSFEWAWNLYRALVDTRELCFAWCTTCEGTYVRDSYALDYQRCASCELKDKELLRRT